MKTGKKIQRLRNSKLWTQEQLAEKSGVSERTISRLENGETISKDSLQRILHALGVTLEEILVDSEESSEKQDTVNYAARICDAKTLANFVADTHHYGYDYDNHLTDEQIEAAQNFLISVNEVIDIWSMLDIQERFELEKFLEELIHDLEKLDLWIFGDKKVDKNNWTTTIIKVCSKNNRSIIKMPYDKAL